MNIFVGNLAFSATEEGVRQLFEGYGTVEGVSELLIPCQMRSPHS
jgi:RNA recognition motif-containing protein